jgi:hypothetical protein
MAIDLSLGHTTGSEPGSAILSRDELSRLRGNLSSQVEGLLHLLLHANALIFFGSRRQLPLRTVVFARTEPASQRMKSPRLDSRECIVYEIGERG